LATEAEAIDMMRLEVAPEKGFGARHRAPERLCASALMDGHG
jgi:hypothetical protein